MPECIFGNELIKYISFKSDLKKSGHCMTPQDNLLAKQES